MKTQDLLDKITHLPERPIDIPTTPPIEPSPPARVRLVRQSPLPLPERKAPHRNDAW